MCLHAKEKRPPKEPRSTRSIHLGSRSGILILPQSITEARIRPDDLDNVQDFTSLAPSPSTTPEVNLFQDVTALERTFRLR